MCSEEGISERMCGICWFIPPLDSFRDFFSHCHPRTPPSLYLPPAASSAIPPQSTTALAPTHSANHVVRCPIHWRPHIIGLPSSWPNFLCSMCLGSPPKLINCECSMPTLPALLLGPQRTKDLPISFEVKISVHYYMTKMKWRLAFAATHSPRTFTYEFDKCK